jgi:hypothetical protein
MPSIRHTLLEWLSAAVWYTGAGVLLWKGTGRFFVAAAGLAPAWPIGVAVGSAALGILQGRTVFRDACVRNLARIRRLESPRPWQFFRPRFFLALAAMIGGAVALSVIADAGPAAALAVAGVDWLIGFSLLVSSEAFWDRTRAAPAPRTVEGAELEEPAA